HGQLAATAESLAYHVVPAGREALAAATWLADDSLRAQARRELERQAAESPFSSIALSLLADLAIVEGRFPYARAMLERAVRTNPATPRAHQRLGTVAMLERDA